MTQHPALQQDSSERPHLRFWRSLVEYEHPEVFQQGQLAAEFPESLDKLPLETSRRRFLQMAGASIALAGLAGCVGKPEEKIVPYVRQPENMIPGVPKQYATAMSLGGSAIGLLVESHMGRPTKVEGNPLHPGSLGASDVFAQAAVLTLYDPERSQAVKNVDRISTWNEFLTDITPRVENLRSRKGQGLRILTPTIDSPTLAGQIQKLLEAMPEAKWHQYEPVSHDNVRAGAKMAFGEVVQPVYDFTKADVILSLDADFLASESGHVRSARDFMSRRNVTDGELKMNRLYAVETTPTLTGAKADHRLGLTVGEVDALTRQIAARLGVDVRQSPKDLDAVPEDWIDVVCEDLKEAGKRGLVIAGTWQPPAVHALAHAINDRLGNTGNAVIYTAPTEPAPTDQVISLASLTSAMRTGQVDLLLILGGNPVFDAPADLNFNAALDSVGYRVHLSLYEDETSANCHWHVPAAHFLESWSDVRAFDGTVSIVQPLIAPLYEGKTPHELIAVALGESAAKPYDIVRSFWMEKREDGSLFSDPETPEEEKIAQLDFEDWWQTVLHDGVMPLSKLTSQGVSISSELVENVNAAGFPAAGGTFDLVFRPDPHIWDGRFANNAWLQELPRPLTQLCWDNAALISPNMAERRRLKNGQMVEIENEGRRLQLPVYILPAHPDNSVTLHFGPGRSRCGSVGKSAGFNAFAVRTSQSMWFASGRRLNATGETYSLATTQDHQAIAQVDEAAHKRHLIKSGTLAELEENPEHPAFMEAGHHTPERSMYKPFPYEGHKWGMSINLGSCIGCNVCTIACQSENNIPVVGKDEVERGREMHWIRVDRYYEGEHEDPQTHFQPVPCMHCELAPCEPVCPVAATTHSDEGLNEMTYNRCVGTRYCANNCPYKVRRFNFFEYTKPIEEHDSLKLLQNPDVTVRSLGVMEKCTYCVQRINQARITAEKDGGRKIRDGEVVTACQQACPTDAIVFGDLNDEGSRIAGLQGEKQPLSYGLLEELNTRPRTTYLASVKNPHPKLKTEESASH